MEILTVAQLVRNSFILRNSNVNCRIQKSHLLVPSLSHKHPQHTLEVRSFKIHFPVISFPTPESSRRFLFFESSNKTFCAFLSYSVRPTITHSANLIFPICGSKFCRAVHFEITASCPFPLVSSIFLSNCCQISMIDMFPLMRETEFQVNTK